MSHHVLGCPARYSDLYDCFCNERAQTPAEYPYLAKLGVTSLGRIAEQIGCELQKRRAEYGAIGQSLEIIGREIQQYEHRRLEFSIPEPGADSAGRSSFGHRYGCGCVNCSG